MKKKNREFKENSQMNCKDQNNKNKIEKKHKTWKTKYVSIFVICDLKNRKQSMENCFEI